MPAIWLRKYPDKIGSHILAVAFGMYRNAVACVIAIAATFLILLAGTFADVLLETARKVVGNHILA